MWHYSQHLIDSLIVRTNELYIVLKFIKGSKNNAHPDTIVILQKQMQK